MAALGVRNIAGYNRKIEEAEKSGNPITDPSVAIPDDMGLGRKISRAARSPNFRVSACYSCGC